MAKTALLIIDHGSKYDQANQLIYEVAKMLETLRNDIIIEVAHMELADPTIEDGFKAAVSKGATTIIAHPYMLGPGRHATKDIPELVHKAAQQFPSIQYEITQPLGVDTKIGELILERANLSSKH